DEGLVQVHYFIKVHTLQRTAVEWETDTAYLPIDSSPFIFAAELSGDINSLWRKILRRTMVSSIRPFRLPYLSLCWRKRRSDPGQRPPNGRLLPRATSAASASCWVVPTRRF
ncbi:hypothetical protein P7K49_013036, partial [Saguinus oedipus]